MMASKATIVFIVYFIQGTLGLAVPESQIVGNRNIYPVDIRDVPFMASVHIRYSICGGSIIHQQFVLTAANCVNKVPSLSDYVRVGSNNHNIRGTKYSIAKYIPHEKYYEANPRKFNYDVGLLKLSRSLTFSAFVAPIKLAFSNILYPGMRAFDSEWRTKDDDEGLWSHKLYEISVTVTPISTCNHYYNSWALTDKNICGDDSGAGVCSGDKGGPLVVGDKQVGIYSSGGNPDDCGYRPIVYVNVTSHINWILSQLH